MAVFVDISQGKSSFRDNLLNLTSNAFLVGSYWGLVTSVFVHIQLWHIIFNIYWIWILAEYYIMRLGEHIGSVSSFCRPLLAQVLSWELLVAQG